MKKFMKFPCVLACILTLSVGSNAQSASFEVVTDVMQLSYEIYGEKEKEKIKVQCFTGSLFKQTATASYLVLPYSPMKKIIAAYENREALKMSQINVRAKYTNGLPFQFNLYFLNDPALLEPTLSSDSKAIVTRGITNIFYDSDYQVVILEVQSLEVNPLSLEVQPVRKNKTKLHVYTTFKEDSKINFLDLSGISTDCIEVMLSDVEKDCIKDERNFLNVAYVNNNLLGDVSRGGILFENNAYLGMIIEVLMAPSEAVTKGSPAPYGVAGLFYVDREHIEKLFAQHIK